jgi:hypothetical protein
MGALGYVAGEVSRQPEFHLLGLAKYLS